MFTKLLESFGHKKEEVDIFENIVGHDRTKQILNLALESDRPVSILLVGPPGVAKTELTLKILNHYRKKAYFTVGSESTKAGMIDYLFEHRPKILVVDELETMPKTDQVVLLGLTQNGILAETKIKKTRQTQLDCSVFATANSTKKILPPLLSRFVVLEIKEYTRPEFIEVSVKILTEAEGQDETVALFIASQVYDNLDMPNPRDCIKIARMYKRIADINMLIEAMKK